MSSLTADAVFQDVQWEAAIRDCCHLDSDLEFAVVCILPYSSDEQSDPNHVVVTTYPSPADGNTPIATVEWVRHEERRVSFKPLIDRQPITAAAALEYATDFANDNGIPIIYHKVTR